MSQGDRDSGGEYPHISGMSSRLHEARGGLRLPKGDEHQRTIPAATCAASATAAAAGQAIEDPVRVIHLPPARTSPQCSIGTSMVQR